MAKPKHNEYSLWAFMAGAWHELLRVKRGPGSHGLDPRCMLERYGEQMTRRDWFEKKRRIWRITKRKWLVLPTGKKP